MVLTFFLPQGEADEVIDLVHSFLATPVAAKDQDRRLRGLGIFIPDPLGLRPLHRVHTLTAFGTSSIDSKRFTGRISSVLNRYKKLRGLGISIPDPLGLRQRCLGLIP